MVARGDEKSFFVIELVYNYGVAHYEPNPPISRASLEFLDLGATPQTMRKNNYRILDLRRAWLL